MKRLNKKKFGKKERYPHKYLSPSENNRQTVYMTHPTPHTPANTSQFPWKGNHVDLKQINVNSGGLGSYFGSACHWSYIVHKYNQ